MKSVCVKLTTAIISIIISISCYANSPVLPKVEKPISVLQEGVDVQLTKEQIAQILPWAKNSKEILERVLFNVEGEVKKQKNRELVRGINKAAIDSYPKNSGLLMRYVLNRGLAIHDVLAKTQSEDQTGAMEMRNRVLEASVKLALKYWQHDLRLLSASKPKMHDRTKFALEYSKFLNHISKSIMSAKAQYTITKLNLKFLAWDLFHDESKKMRMASSIRDLHYAVDLLNPNGYVDQMAISKVRRMKKVRARAIIKIENIFKIIKEEEKKTAEEKVTEEKRKTEERKRIEDEKRRKLEEVKRKIEDAKRKIEDAKRKIEEDKRRKEEAKKERIWEAREKRKRLREARQEARKRVREERRHRRIARVLKARRGRLNCRIPKNGFLSKGAHSPGFYKYNYKTKSLEYTLSDVGDGERFILLSKKAIKKTITGSLYYYVFVKLVDSDKTGYVWIDSTSFGDTCL